MTGQPGPSGDHLTRETRYTGRAWLEGSSSHDVVLGQRLIDGDTGKVELTFCRSCGSAVVIGREDSHEMLHVPHEDTP